MKEEYSTAIEKLKTKIAELKNDTKEKTQSLKNDAQDAIKTTQLSSQDEINKIRFSTNELAMAETKKQIENIFASNKIQDLIENQATREVRDKVTQLIDEEIKRSQEVTDAASQMRVGLYEGMTALRNFFDRPTNKIDSANAKRLYDNICKDYEKNVLDNVQYLQPMLGSLNIVNDSITTEQGKQELAAMMATINQPVAGLNEIAIAIYHISKHTGIPFKPFQIDQINSWYSKLKNRK